MSKSLDQHKKQLITDLISARQAIFAEITTLPEERLDQPCIGIWCVKDLLAHLIGWDYTNIQSVQEILAGQRPTFFRYYDQDWRSYNAHLVETYRKEAFQELCKDAEISHTRLVILLQSLSAEEVVNGKSPPEQGRTITIRNLLKSETSDERKHAEQLHAIFADTR